MLSQVSRQLPTQSGPIDTSRWKRRPGPEKSWIYSNCFIGRFTRVTRMSQHLLRLTQHLWITHLLTFINEKYGEVGVEKSKNIITMLAGQIWGPKKTVSQQSPLCSNKSKQCRTHRDTWRFIVILISNAVHWAARTKKTDKTSGSGLYSTGPLRLGCTPQDWNR